MSKLLCVVLVALIGSVAPAHADVVEASPEPAPGAERSGAEVVDEPAVLGPSMVAPRPAIVRDTTDEKPPLTGNRIVGQALLGSLFAVGGVFGGGYLGYSLETRGSCHSEWCGVGGAILGAGIGLTVAAPFGVYLAGSSSGQTGSYGAALGGSVLGTLAGIAVVAAAENEAAIPALLIGPVVGSMIGFNMTRKYERPRARKQWAPVASVSSGNSMFGVAGAF